MNLGGLSPVCCLNVMRTGTPVGQGVNEIYFDLYLPSGVKPAGARFFEVPIVLPLPEGLDWIP